MAVQCRASDYETIKYLQEIEHTTTRKAVTAERSFLEALGGGCSLPIGAFARVEEDIISMQAEIISPDGEKIMRYKGQHSDAHALGVNMAEQAIKQGAQTLLP